MAKNLETVVEDILAHFRKSGLHPARWYVGIAQDPKQRLFSDHGVRQKGDWWVHVEAISEDVARAAERHLIDIVGMKGGTGGGTAATRFVYAYVIAPHTAETT